MERMIAHLDMDAFFASVEERDNPRLRGLPIVVGADPMEGKGRGVVSTANYAARAYSIRSALPISKAWQFSQKAKRKGRPEVIFLDVDFRKYSKVSHEIMEIIRKYSSTIEQASIDEAYIDLTHVESFENAIEICKKIKQEIKEKEKLTASIGLGPNKLIAKIASDMQKPDGLTVVHPEQVENFLEPLPIRKMPGIGPKTELFFKKQGVMTINDLKKYSKDDMRNMLGSPRTNFAQTQSVFRPKASTKLVRGKWGFDLYDRIRGIDESPVTEEYEIKSIGEQETFREDTLDFKFVFERIEGLCESVIRRLKHSDFKKFRTVVITIRFSGFETKIRSHTMPKPAGSLKVLKGEIAKLLMPFFDARENPKRKKIRLIGVRIEKLS